HGRRAEDGRRQARIQVRDGGQRQGDGERDAHRLERQRRVHVQRLRDVAPVAGDVVPAEPRVHDSTLPGRGRFATRGGTVARMAGVAIEFRAARKEYPDGTVAVESLDLAVAGGE